MKRLGALEKAFQILQLLAQEPEQLMPLSDIADRLSLNRATCAHVLKNLGV